MKEDDGRAEPTPMGDQGDARALRRDPVAGEQEGRGAVLPGPLHDLGARGDGAPLGSGTAPGAGPAVPRDRGANGRVDDDRHARGALAASWRGRLPAGARPSGDLKVALPAKG